MEVSSEVKGRLFQYVMENVPVRVFNQAQKEYSTRRLYYWLKNDLMREFKDVFNGSQLWFSVIMTDVFREYAIDDVAAIERERKISKLFRDHKLYTKHHPRRRELIEEHNALVDFHNQECAPLMKLIKEYMRIQKQITK